MEARDTTIANQIAIKNLCNGCVLAEGHNVSPDIIQVSPEHDSEVKTTLIISSLNGKIESTQQQLPGIPRIDGILGMIDVKITPESSAEQTPDPESSVACNGLCAALNQARKA